MADFADDFRLTNTAATIAVLSHLNQVCSGTLAELNQLQAAVDAYEQQHEKESNP